MHSIRIHPLVAGSALLGCAMLALARGQQVQRLPTLTAEQAEILSHMSIVYLDDGQGGQQETIRFTGVNVQVVNGLGATETKNGVGNLIVGYNEPGLPFGDDRTGSHNIVGGIRNSYGSHGGLVVGRANTILAPWAVVSGGAANRASGQDSSVSGGYANESLGNYSSVSGGGQSLASGEYSSVSGGNVNVAAANASWVGGGELNRAEGFLSSVCGGEQNKSAGYGSTIGGGLGRTVAGTDDWAAGSLFEEQ